MSTTDALAIIRLRFTPIWYFAKISSIRLNAFSIAASGFMPSFATSIIARLHTCWERTCANARL